MELTTQQLKRIEAYLNAKGMFYIDFRIEILDHIISEIEGKLSTTDVSFDKAFYEVTNKWNNELIKTKSFDLGLMYLAPKPVLNMAKKIYKKAFLKITLFSIIPMFFINFLRKYLLSYTSELLSVVVLISLSLILLYIQIKTRKDNIKTVYSFLIKTQELVILLSVFSLLIKVNSKIDLLDLIFYIFSSYTILLYKKHLNEKKKYIGKKL